MTFKIKLPLFEGPFDLLLFFIERDELDIHDIPISRIAKDFLDYLHRLEELNIEVASEFILVAATLMKIKAKILLPRPVIDEEGNEVDPREDLVRHLLEYRKYKSVIDSFSKMEEQRLQKNRRGNIEKELRALASSNNVETELQDVDLYKLLKVYQKVLDRYEIEKNRPRHQVEQYPYTISGQKDYILGKLKDLSRLTFEELMTDNPTRVSVIFNFLAVLDLVQLREIKVNVGLGYNNFWICPPDEERVRKKPKKISDS